MWMLFALLSAIFAALTSNLAKIGIEGIDSNLATAIRTVTFVFLHEEFSVKSFIGCILIGAGTLCMVM